MIITKLSGGFLAAVYPNAGIDRVTGKPVAERIYGRDQEELKQRIRIRFELGASRDLRRRKKVV